MTLALSHNKIARWSGRLLSSQHQERTWIMTKQNLKLQNKKVNNQKRHWLPDTRQATDLTSQVGYSPVTGAGKHHENTKKGKQQKKRLDL